MKNYQALSAILGGEWLIDKAWAEKQLPLIAGIFKGESFPLSNKYALEDDDQSERGDKKGQVFCVAPGTFTASRYRSFKEAPEGSVAIIPVSGPIMKYDGMCGGLGSMSIARMVDDMNNSSNMIGGLLDTDSPGGQVSGTPTAGDAIRNSRKPIVGYVNDGMAASAAYWYLSGCREIYASQLTDTIGSIGVYTSFADFTAYYESLGIKIHEIYSDLSKDKNKDYKDALKGDYTGIKEHINHIAEQFIATVKQNRGDKLNVALTTTGKMFNAQKAQEHGLIDGIISFEAAVQRVHELSSNTSQSSNNSKNTNMKFSLKSSMTALLSFFGASVATGADSVEKEISAEDLDRLNTELAEKNTLTQKVKDLESAAAAATSAHEAALSAANKATTDANKATTDMTADRDAWKLKAEEFGAQPGAMGTNPPKTKTDDIEDSADKDQVADPEAEHNKEAMRSLGLS